MKGSNAILCLVAGVFAAGCDKPEVSSSIPGSAPVAEQPAKKEVVRLHFTTGMPYEQAEADLLKAGAQRVEGAYHLPWTSGEPGKPGGYHAYFDLPDGRCVQLGIRESQPQERVVSFGISPKHYVGKMEWFADEDKGVIQSASIFDMEVAK